MYPDRYATFAQALVRAREKLPFDVHPIDVLLANGISSTAITAGDLVMLDQSTTGVDTDGNYTQVIAPTTAGNLATAGSYHLVAVKDVAAGESGYFRLFGDVKLNLNASSATVGTLLYTRGTNKDATNAVTAGGKIIGKTKIATTTGVVRVFFDGRGLAAVPTLVGLQEEAFYHRDIYVGTTTPMVTGTVEIATNSLVVNRTWNATNTTGDYIAWFDWAPPKRWDLGTVTFQICWSSVTATAGPVVYALDAVACSDSDTLDATVGTAVTVTDSAAATANLPYMSPVSAALTIAGTPAVGDIVKFRIRRTGDAGGDTLNVVTRLHWVKVFWTSNAVTDD